MSNRGDYYEEYMKRTGPIVASLENQLHEIKDSDDWKNAMNYFKQAKYSKKLLEAPSKVNGYIIKKIN